MNWNQALCERCWIRQYGGRIPHRMIDPELERCSNCGDDTRSGIYVRRDPRKVNYPTMEEVNTVRDDPMGLLSDPEDRA